MPVFNDELVVSRWAAYDPDGNFKEIVKLTYRAKQRYEAKGWTFRRPGRQVWGVD